MQTPSDRTTTLAGLRRNTRLTSIGTGGWLRSESMADFVGIRTLETIAPLGDNPLVSLPPLAA